MSTTFEKLSLLKELIAPKSYFALLISLGLLTLLSAGVADGPLARIMVIVFALSMVSSIGMAVSTTKRLAVGMFIGGFVVFAMLVMSNVILAVSLHTKFFRMASYIMAIVYMLTASVTILQDVFSGQVNANRICGAICFYVLIGMCFGMFFFALDLHDPTCFKIEHFYDGTPRVGLPISLHDRFTLFNYFSFCTLSTAGFGDITPVSQAARTFSWLEAIFGQLYLSILVARLVGLHIAGATLTMADQKTAGNSDTISNSTLDPEPSAES
jgi:hypothetical protein